MLSGLDLLGWVGGALGALAYVLVSTRRVAPEAAMFQGMNVAAAVLLGTAAYSSGAISNATVNVVWIAFGTHAIMTSGRRRATAPRTVAAPERVPTPELVGVGAVAGAGHRPALDHTPADHVPADRLRAARACPGPRRPPARDRRGSRPSGAKATRSCRRWATEGLPEVDGEGPSAK